MRRPGVEPGSQRFCVTFFGVTCKGACPIRWQRRVLTTILSAHEKVKEEGFKKVVVRKNLKTKGVKNRLLKRQ